MLSHGLKFCIPPKKIVREEVFGEFEVLVGQLKHHSPRSPKDLQKFHTKLIDLSHSYSGTPIDKKDFHMRKECFEAARSLKLNNEIVISGPDKGSGLPASSSSNAMNTSAK